MSDQTSIRLKAVLEQVERIACDPLFIHSKRYSNLLKYIVDRTLEGAHESLKERIIGIEVFGKSPDFDSSVDSTVRVTAAEVRKRLSVYYSDPAHEQELRIELPLRSYIAEFKTSEAPQEQQAEAKRNVLGRRRLAAIAAAVIVVMTVSWAGYRWLRPRSTIDQFWAPLQNYSGPVAISVGSPPRENPTSTGTASNINAFNQPHADFPLYDLQTATALTSFLGLRGKPCMMLFAQTTTLAELKGQPVVLIGSHRNEWAVRLGEDAHFLFKHASPDGLNWIEDRSNPSSQKWSVDKSLSYEKTTKEYALVTRALSKSTDQWWIGVAGLTGAGTYAAQQMLLDTEAMSALGRQLPKGWEQKNLQVVLEIPVVKGSPGMAYAVAIHTW